MNKDIILEHLQLIFLFGLLAVITHWAAKSKGFFAFPEETKKTKEVTVRGKQVISVFVIYLAAALLIAPILVKIVLASVSLSPISIMGLLQFASMGLIVLLLFLYCLTQDRTLMRRIWFDDKRGQALGRDFALGAVIWVVAFPLVVAVGQFSDLLLYIFLQVENYEQVAVHFLKSALSSRLLLPLAMLAVLVVAPAIEEMLFRGFLQSFFRRYFGSKGAIMLAALCFAIFHLSSSQGWGNISLAVSLFTFALYLGFLYERQRTLLAPIGLHMAFNMVSSMRILFVQEG